MSERILTLSRENEYILTGYRAPSNSWVKSVRSILGIHNETSELLHQELQCPKNVKS
jgi:hypothetical protein